MSTISTKERDFLSVDDPIRGQAYACVSFVHPENIIKERKHFMFEKYLQNVSKDLNELLNDLTKVSTEESSNGFKANIVALKDRYPALLNNEVSKDFEYFLTQNEEELGKEFDEKHDFQTSVQAIKIRGVYASLQEAEARSKKLRVLDDNKFDIYIAEVGCWCPWNPNPSTMQNQEFVETELNTLMSRYMENAENRDKAFENRTTTLKKDMKEPTIEEVIDSEGDDPWMKNKAEIMV